MFLNSSATAWYDQILKQMKIGREIKREGEKRIEEREEKMVLWCEEECEAPRCFCFFKKCGYINYNYHLVLLLN